MRLEDIDLNLLVVFDQMLAARSVSATAARLGSSQPAISNALARLRRTLGDELFTRVGNSMHPTPLAQAMAGPVADALAALQVALNQRTLFEPALSRRTFVISMSDIGEMVFLPRLMQALATHAPGVGLAAVGNAQPDLKLAMSEGRVDLAIGLLPQLQAGFYKRRLFRQRYVCLMRTGHPLERSRQFTLRAFAAAQHVAVDSGGTGHGALEQVFRRVDVQRDIRLRVPHFVAVGPVLATSDLIATVPQRLAEVLARPHGLFWRAPPMPIPPVDISAFWHARYHRDPGNRWLRETLFAQFARTAGPVESVTSTD